VDRGRLCQRSACSGHVACRDGSATWAGEAPGQGASDTQTSARCAGSPSEIGSRLANASSRGVGEIRPTSLFALRGSSQYRAVHNQQFKGRLKEGTSSFTTEWQAFKWMSASCCRSLRTGQAAIGQALLLRAHPGHTAQIMKFPKADDRCHRVCLILEAASRCHDSRAPWGGPQCIIKSSSGTHRRHLPTRWSGNHSSRFCCNACDKPAPSTFVGLRLSLSREQHDHCQAQEDHADVE